MQEIKFINSTTIKLNGQTYKGYPVGELPKRFRVYLQRRQRSRRYH